VGAGVVSGVETEPAIAPPQTGSSRTNRRRLIGAIVLAGAAAASIAVVQYRAPGHLRRADASERPRVVAPQLPVPAATQAPESITKQSAPALAVPNPPKEESRQDRNQAAIPIPVESKLPKPSPAGEETVLNSPDAAESKTPAPKPPVVASESPLKIQADRPAEAPIASPPPVEPPALQPNPAGPVLAAAPAEALIPKPPETPVPQAGHTFLGPKVIHQVAPAVPRGVGPRITTDVQLDVEVRIDASGKVTAARVASTQGAAAQLLTIEVLKAAQMFRFQPAREDGRAVPGTMVLTFHFEPIAKANKE
jgi:periplasmic protein TonB